jgi:hypothetical protein
MPEKIKSVVISLDGQKEAYRSGDTVKGYWKLTSEKEFTTKGIISDFHGVAFVKWTEYNTTTLKNDDLTSYEVYVRETIQLHGTGGGYFCLRGVRKRNNTTSRNRRWVFLS